MEETNSCCAGKFKEPKFILAVLGIIILGAVVIVSILRDRIVNVSQNQITVMGQGKVEYQPDQAAVTLGVRVEKAPRAEDALNQLNDKMKKIIDSVSALGIEKDNIKTRDYNLYPAYDYTDGNSRVSGYSATQNLEIKVESADKDPELVSRVVSAAGAAGSNEVQGVRYSVSDLNSIKQEARIKAIEDARQKAGALAKAAGIKKLGKVAGWYENNIGTPEAMYDSAMAVPEGRGGGELKSAPQIPSGTQEIVIEVGVNFEVR